MFNKFIQSELVIDLKQVVVFMKKTRVSFKFFSLSLAFSLGLTLFNLYTVSLLFPLVQGIISGDFSHVKKLMLVGSIVSAWPDVFKSSVSLFILLTVWIYVNIFLKNILRYIASVSSGYQARGAMANMRNLLFDKCLAFGKSFYDKNKISDIHRIIAQSPRVINEQFKSLQDFIIDNFLIVMYFGAMLYISWKLTFIACISFPIINILTKKIIQAIKESIKKKEEAEISLGNRIYNILSCMPLVKGFAREDYERRAYQAASLKETDEAYKINKIYSWLAPIEDIGATTSMLMLAFGMAFIIYFDRTLDATSAFVFFYLAQNLMNKRTAYNNFKFSIVRLGRMADDINSLLEKNNDYVISGGDVLFENFEKEIKIKNLSFSYNGSEKNIFENLSLAILKGKTTAIVGPTGSGKSTLANLLLRFYDCPPDSICIDDMDIRKFSLSSLHNKISFINQDSLLFNDTVSKNIAYGLPGDDSSDKKVLAIGEKTTVSDFVERLPLKYETVVEENGANFSGGEKQRIAIARALVRDYEILIMDEATNALDANTEEKVMKAIKEASTGKTLIVIAHRLSTIKDADNIIFLDQGRIKESGTLEELLVKKGAFYNDWIKQKL